MFRVASESPSSVCAAVCEAFSSSLARSESAPLSSRFQRIRCPRRKLLRVSEPPWPGSRSASPRLATQKPGRARSVLGPTVAPLSDIPRCQLLVDVLPDLHFGAGVVRCPQENSDLELRTTMAIEKIEQERRPPVPCASNLPPEQNLRREGTGVHVTNCHEPEKGIDRARTIPTG